MIDHIKIAGYKSIKTLSLALGPVNLLIGSNGAGKSNFISFFKFLNTVYEQRLRSFSLKYGADDILFFGRKSTQELQAYISFDDINAYEINLHYGNDNTFFVHEEHTYFNKKGYGKSEWLQTLISTEVSEAQITNRNSTISTFVKGYLQSLMVYHFHDTSENAALRSPSDVNDNQSLRENGSNLPAFLFYLQEKHPTNFKRIENAVRSIAPFFSRFQLQPLRLNDQKIQLEWIQEDHPERYFNASHLSDGTLRFIALATLLLQPEPPEVIIIDEPELGLHPVAINKLSGMIRAAEGKKRQIIISTQSVGLVNDFEAGEIITVDRNVDESSFSRLDPEKLKLWLDDYSVGDLWSKSIIKGQP
ncbi:MAG: AAA family ATPase [Bacteroidota bacterium]